MSEILRACPADRPADQGSPRSASHAIAAGTGIVSVLALMASDATPVYG